MLSREVNRRCRCMFTIYETFTELGCALNSCMHARVRPCPRLISVLALPVASPNSNHKEDAHVITFAHCRLNKLWDTRARRLHTIHYVQGKDSHTPLLAPHTHEMQEGRCLSAPHLVLFIYNHSACRHEPI